MKSAIIGLVALVAISFNAQAGMTVVLQDHGSNAYTAYVNGTEAVGIWQPGQTFKTFCLETNEYYNPGLTYNVQISTAAIKGGVGGAQPDPVYGTSDPLDPRTAFLYHSYMDGERFVSAAKPLGYADSEFQRAIHYIEGEGGASNGLVTIATQAVNSGIWSGLGDVRVMNVWYQCGKLAQDQLVQVSMTVPAPAAIILGGIGTIIVGALRRKRAL